MSENPIGPFRPDPPRSEAPRVVMVRRDSRKLTVILFSVALVLGAGIGILAFLAGRRSEVGKIHPPDFAPFPPVQAAKPPPPPLQIVPLPEGSLVRQEPPSPTPGSPVKLDLGEVASEGQAAPRQEAPEIVIRRHEPRRDRGPSVRSPRALPVAPGPVPLDLNPLPPASAGPEETLPPPSLASDPNTEIEAPIAAPALGSDFDPPVAPPPP